MNGSTLMVFVTHLLVDDCEILELSPTQPPPLHVGYPGPGSTVDVACPKLDFCFILDCHYSVAKSCLTLYDPINCSMPSFPVLYYFLEFAQTHIH